jgi:hypothetical protein
LSSIRPGRARLNPHKQNRRQLSWTTKRSAMRAQAIASISNKTHPRWHCRLVGILGKKNQPGDKPLAQSWRVEDLAGEARSWLRAGGRQRSRDRRRHCKNHLCVTSHVHASSSHFRADRSDRGFRIPPAAIWAVTGCIRAGRIIIKNSAAINLNCRGTLQEHACRSNNQPVTVAACVAFRSNVPIMASRRIHACTCHKHAHSSH